MVVKRQGNIYANDENTKPGNTSIAPLTEFVELQDIEFEIDRAISPTPTATEHPKTAPNGSVPNGSVPHHAQPNGHVPQSPYMDEADDTPNEVSVLIKAPDTQSNTGPIDKWKIVYWIFALHGLGTLLPWNMFITAEAYFTEHKFGNVSDSAEYKDKFLSYLGIAGFVPTLCFMAATLFLQHRTMTKSRIGYSILLMILLFILTVILAILDTSSWPGIFYGVTMGTVVVFNGASAVYQSSLFGFAGRLPVKYTQGVLAGQGLGGTFVSLVSILSITVASSLRSAAIGYFACATVVLVICYISFLIMNRMPFVKFYLHQAHENEPEDKEKKVDEPEDKEKQIDDTPTRPETPPFLKIFWKIKWQLFNIWMVFFVTLSIFPAVLVQVEPSGEMTDFKTKYFTPLTCFLLFNLCDFVGSIFPVWVQWPRSRYLWIATTSRLVFFPIFLFCNYRPDARTLPVLINNDIVYVILVMIFSLSSGYLKSLPMMAAPKLVQPQHSATAGAMMALFLVIGIFSGLNFSLVFPAVVAM